MAPNIKNKVTNAQRSYKLWAGEDFICVWVRTLCNVYIYIRTYTSAYFTMATNVHHLTFDLFDTCRDLSVVCQH